MFHQIFHIAVQRFAQLEQRFSSRLFPPLLLPFKKWTQCKETLESKPVLSAAGRSFPDEYADWYADLLVL